MLTVVGYIYTRAVCPRQGNNELTNFANETFSLFPVLNFSLNLPTGKNIPSIGLAFVRARVSNSFEKDFFVYSITRNRRFALICPETQQTVLRPTMSIPYSLVSPPKYPRVIIYEFVFRPIFYRKFVDAFKRQIRNISEINQFYRYYGQSILRGTQLIGVR